MLGYRIVNTKTGIEFPIGPTEFLLFKPPGKETCPLCAGIHVRRTESTKTVTMEGMGFVSNGGPCRSLVEGERLNVFALVIYIPLPLGRFLDELRRELVPHYNPHAHVSVLPPRPLTVDWRIASDQARTLSEGWAPFDVALSSVEVFPLTDVIYIEIGAGAKELYELHAAMNTSALAFGEPYPYHPHITLAQELPVGSVNDRFGFEQRQELLRSNFIARFLGGLFQHRVLDDLLSDHLLQLHPIELKDRDHLNKAGGQNLLLRDLQLQSWRQ